MIAYPSRNSNKVFLNNIKLLSFYYIIKNFFDYLKKDDRIFKQF